MEPMQIPLGPNKYQTCVVKGCDADAVTEFYAMSSKGSMKCLGACPHHIKEVRSLAVEIVTGKTVVYAEEHCFDSTIIGWGKFKKLDATPPPAASAPMARKRAPVVEEVPEKPAMVRSVTDALSGWNWVTERGMWRNVVGEVVHVKSLSDDELLSAVLAIAGTNWQRLKADMAIVKGLPMPAVVYTYPEKELKVGKAIAKNKVIDMCEEWFKRTKH